MMKITAKGLELNPDTLRDQIGELSLRSLSAYYHLDADVLDDLDRKLEVLPV